MSRVYVGFGLLCFLILPFTPKSFGQSCEAQPVTAARYPIDNWHGGCGFTEYCWAPNHLGDDGSPATAKTPADVVDTVVVSPVTGVVKESQVHGGYGGTVIIQAFDGTECVTILIGHLRHYKPGDLLVSPGPITIGKPLGRIAPTIENGGLYKPHVHMGIHKGAYASINLICMGNKEWDYAGYTKCPDTVFPMWYSPKTFIESHTGIQTVATNATIDGIRWPSSGFGAVSYSIGCPFRAIIGTGVPASTSDVPTGSCTLIYNSGGPSSSRLVGISPCAGPLLTSCTAPLAAGQTLTFTLLFASNAPPIGANYQADFQGPTPKTGWRYLWNSAGPFGNPANYLPLVFCSSDCNAFGTGVTIYDLDGGPLPRSSPASDASLAANFGHPGSGTGQGASFDRFAIAAFTFAASGHYKIGGSSLTRLQGATNGDIQLLINIDSGPILFNQITTGTISFDIDLGNVVAGQTLYVGVGPDESDFSDSFSLQYLITQM